jgi:hypothetical protein
VNCSVFAGVWYRGHADKGGLPTLAVVVVLLLAVESGHVYYYPCDGTSGARVFHIRRCLFCAIHACPRIGIIETDSTTATARLGEMESQATTIGLD